jgi:hypothetical protein
MPGDQVHEKDVDELGLAKYSIKENEIAISFDLDKPIGPQVESAKRMAIEYQIIRHGKRIQKRRHPTKWLTYLRILDARSAGASWAEASHALPPTNAGGALAARDAHEQALALSFNF